MEGGVALDAAPVKHEPECATFTFHRVVSDGEAWPERAGVTHREPVGTTGVEHDTAQQNTITDTLQHTAETHTYKCDTCSQIFLQKQCLIDHVKVHLREASERLPNESLFIREPSDTVKKYSCKICKKKFRKNYLKIHERFHTGEKPYTCEVCKKQFAVLGSLREHKRIHTEERPYSCDLCEKSYARSSYLKIHKLSHTKEKPYECEICKKRFAQTSNLKSHIRTHTGEKPYGCTVCKKRFTQWSALETHKRTHAGSKPYSCEICKKKFTQFGNLKTHKRIHMEEKGAQDKLYAHVTKDKLVLGPGHTQRPNVLSALGKKSLRSVVCEYGPALDRCAVTAHREPAETTGAEHDTAQQNTITDTLQHTAETNTCKCNTCGLILLQKQCLIDHIKVQHLRERSETLPTESLFIYDPSDASVNKYTCRLCDKKFRKDYLKIHERFHTGEKPYTCEVCKKQFAVLGNLRQHKRIHTEEKDAQGELYAQVTKNELVLGPGHTQRLYTVNALGVKSQSLVCGYRPSLDRCAVTAREPAWTTGAAHDTVQPNTITDTLHHSAETNTYKCDTCSLIFLQKHCLNDHVKVHLREASETLPNESLFIREPSDKSVKKYSCKICKKKFRKNYLKIHERIHSGEKPYVCEVCKKEFAVLGNLRDHKRMHTEERPYSCDACGKSFARSAHLKTHELSHTGEKPYKCETCKKGFSQLTNLQAHIRIHTGEKPYPCTMCDKQFTQWRALNNHKRSHTGEKTYQCDTSKKKIKQLGALNVHNIINTIEKPFSCETCKKTFRKKSFEQHKHEAVCVKEKSESESSTDQCGSSETHKETRVKEEPQRESSANPCGTSETQVKEEPKCERSTDVYRVNEMGADHLIKIELELEPEGVQRDIAVVPRAASPRCELLAAASGAPGAPQPAPPPGTNTTRDALQATTAGTQVGKQNHSTIDKQMTTKRLYTCEICTKTFTQSGSLNTHKRIHTGEKPYSCEACNKQFTALATLNNHKIAVHTHIKPYTCEICNKGFKGLRSLKSHGLIHTGSKPYTCDVCKKQFRHESALRVHNRIHTGVKPYSCPICKQQFRRTGGVKAHIIHMHTEEKPFACEICKKQFATKGSLKFHVGIHAKDES